MKVIIKTDVSNKEFFESEAVYYLEKAEEYGYKIREDFDFSIEFTDSSKEHLKITIFEKDITVVAEDDWITIQEGYVLDDFLVRKNVIEKMTITF